MPIPLFYLFFPKEVHDLYRSRHRGAAARGKPLHFKKLTEIAIRENLLDHVGKVPDDTMAGLLAAHCRLPRTERQLLPVQLGTFALAEWGLEEDPAGLEGIVEAPPEDELAYRSRERHPMPSRDLSRGGGRGEARPRRHEEERRGRRFPPPAEVAYEILAGAGKPLPVSEIAVTGAERLLMPDAFIRDAGALRSALDEDNRRREGDGRKPLFQMDGDVVTLVAQPEPGERPAPAAAPRAMGAMGAGELRRAALAALRRRLRECDGPTVEHVALRLLEKLGFRDVKVAKRGREHVVCTARKRMGLADVRHAVRVLRAGTDAARRDVSDLRRDLGHYGAQIGIIVSAGDAARDARGEAAAAGQLPVILLCGEGFAEALAEVSLGCVPVVVPEVDESFFQTAAEQAVREEDARRARREERDRREERGERREPREAREPARDEVSLGEINTRIIAEVAADEAEPAEAPAEGGPAAPVSAGVGALAGDAPEVGGAAPVEDEGDTDEEGDEGEEGGEEESPAVEGAEAEGAPGAGSAPGGERRRRRRRRRRRGGRGRGAREGAPAQGGGEAGGAAAAAPSGPPQAQPATSERAEPPPLPPPSRDPPAGEGA
jgi:hypothetical protein